MKKLMITTLLLSLALFLCSCGKKDDNTIDVNPPSPTAVPDYLHECGGKITLGEYKGLTFSNDTEVTDKDVEEAVKEFLDYAPNYVKDESRDNTEVKDGDVLNIDYLGKMDGEAFAGGKAEGATLEIGSNAFIDGFESSLIGKKVGETCDITVTFPKSYPNNPDLAGKPAVFTVTINYVCMKLDELTDEYVAAQTQEKYKTVDEFLKYLRESLETEKKDNLEANKLRQLIDKVIENSTFEVDSADIKYFVERTMGEYENYASMYGMTVKDLVMAMGDYKNYEDFEKEVNDGAEQTVKQYMVLQAIAKAENIALDDAAYKKAAEEYMKGTQIDNLADFEGTYGKDYIVYCITCDMAWDVLIDNAKEVPFEPKQEESGEQTEESGEQAEESGEEGSEESSDDNQ